MPYKLSHQNQDKELFINFYAIRNAPGKSFITSMWPEIMFFLHIENHKRIVSIYFRCVTPYIYYAVKKSKSVLKIFALTYQFRLKALSLLEC